MASSNEYVPPSAPDLIGVLVSNHQRFHAFLEHRVGDAADAEDILQAAFLRSIKKSDTIRDGETVVAWFYRLLRNALTDHYRHRAAEHKALARATGRRCNRPAASVLGG